MNFDFAYSLEGGNYPPIAKTFAIGANQTIKQGDALVLASGKLVKATNTMSRIFGVAAQDVITGANGGDARVYVAQHGQVWRASASANATTHVLATRTYAINDNQQVNVAASTGGCVTIVELGETNVDVYVTFSAVEL